MFINQLPVIEYRRHLPMAILTATVLNMMGGKPRGNKPPDPSYVPWSPHELMPSFAQLEGMISNPLAISEETARQFFKLSREGKLPSWVLAISNIPQLRVLAGLEP